MFSLERETTISIEKILENNAQLSTNEHPGPWAPRPYSLHTISHREKPGLLGEMIDSRSRVRNIMRVKHHTPESEEATKYS